MANSQSCGACAHFIPDAPGVKWGAKDNGGRCVKLYESWPEEAKRRTWKSWAEVTGAEGTDCALYRENNAEREPAA